MSDAQSGCSMEAEPHELTGYLAGPVTLEACRSLYPRLFKAFREQAPWWTPSQVYVRGLCEARHDPMHDFFHMMRVVSWSASLFLAGGAKGNLHVIMAAALFHDAVVRRKDDPQRDRDTVESAQLAEQKLTEYGFPVAHIPHAAHIIRNCSFSFGGGPQSPEEAIVRDADMLECLGEVGLFRFFAGSGAMNRALIDLSTSSRDPNRTPDRSRWTVDTIKTRGLAVMDRFQTPAAKVFVQELGLEQRLCDCLDHIDQETRHAVDAYGLLIEADSL